MHSPISLSQQHDLLAYLQSVFQLNVSNWQRFFICNRPLGILNPRWQRQLQQDLGDAITQDHAGMHLQGSDWLHCGDVLQHLGREWYDLGLFDGWRNELFDVMDQGEALFTLERSLFRPLGLLSQAVHINGFVRQENELLMWIGKRSPFKAVDPDKLDNLVGGGVSSGESLAQACQREGFEEAGLDSQFTASLPTPRKILSQRTVSRGLHREHLAVYDVFLPSHMRPENQDGEVATFELMPLPTIVDAMLNGRFMNDAILVTLDGWLQQGCIDQDAPLAQWLLSQRC